MHSNASSYFFQVLFGNKGPPAFTWNTYKISRAVRALLQHYLVKGCFTTSFLNIQECPEFIMPIWHLLYQILFYVKSHFKWLLIPATHTCSVVAQTFTQDHDHKICQDLCDKHQFLGQNSFELDDSSDCSPGCSSGSSRLAEMHNCAMTEWRLLFLLLWLCAVCIHEANIIKTMWPSSLWKPDL